MADERDGPGRPALLRNDVQQPIRGRVVDAPVVVDERAEAAALDDVRPGLAGAHGGRAQHQVDADTPLLEPLAHRPRVGVTALGERTLVIRAAAGVGRLGMADDDQLAGCCSHAEIMSLRAGRNHVLEGFVGGETGQFAAQQA